MPILCELAGLQDQPARGKGALILEPAHLEAGGLTAGHLAALLAAGCLEEACIPLRRASQAGKCHRSVRTSDSQPGLLLTEVGRALLPCYLLPSRESPAEALRITRVVSALRHMAERPVWKSLEGELWWWGTLVKRYRNDAAYQRCVLGKFQVSGWTNCISNPLPSRGAIGGKRQLSCTIENLNRSQHPLRIRFRSTGGSVILWEENI